MTENTKGEKKTRETMSRRQTHTPASAFMSGNTGSPQMSTAALHAEWLQHAGVINSTINLLYAAFFHARSTIKNSEQQKNLKNAPKQPSSGCIGKVLVELAAALPATALGGHSPSVSKRPISALTAAITVYRAF